MAQSEQERKAQPSAQERADKAGNPVAADPAGGGTSAT